MANNQNQTYIISSITTRRQNNTVISWRQSHNNKYDKTTAYTLTQHSLNISHLFTYCELVTNEACLINTKMHVPNHRLQIELAAFSNNKGILLNVHVWGHSQFFDDSIGFTPLLWLIWQQLNAGVLLRRNHQIITIATLTSITLMRIITTRIASSLPRCCLQTSTLSGTSCVPSSDDTSFISRDICHNTQG